MRTPEGEERAKEARAKYNRENMKTLGVNVRKEIAEQFAAVAEKRGLTASRLLHDYVSAVIRGMDETNGMKEEKRKMVAPRTAFDMRVTEKNFNNLYHEVSFHNPKHLNPEELMNDILDRYFKLAHDFRKDTSK